MNSTELAHYGVKGMKWGIRRKRTYYDRAADRAKKASDASNRDADDLEKHGYSNESKAVRSVASRQQRKSDFLREAGGVNASRTKGAKLVTNLLAGPFANRTYNTMIAAGNSRVVSAGATFVTGTIGGPLGHIIVSSIVTGDASDRRRA